MKVEERINLIQNGQDYRLYEFLGSHLGKKNGKDGVYFRAYAPNAAAISVIGEFNAWDKTAHVMKRIKNSNIWEVFKNLKIF